MAVAQPSRRKFKLGHLVSPYDLKSPEVKEAEAIRSNVSFGRNPAFATS